MIIIFKYLGPKNGENMKKISTKKFGLMMLLCLLLTIQTVASLGIPTPFPGNLKMLRGDTAEFKMQIQASSEPTDLSCTPYVQGFDPLIITFSEETVIVKSGEIKDIWGTVKIPNNAEIKTYEGTVHAKCTPIVAEQDVGGSRMNKIPGNKWSLSVVSTAAERHIPSFTTTTTPAKPSPTPTIPTSTIITIIIIIAVLAIGVYYWFERRKKK
jgi:hypothetical protein